MKSTQKIKLPIIRYSSNSRERQYEQISKNLLENQSATYSQPSTIRKKKGKFNIVPKPNMTLNKQQSSRNGPEYNFGSIDFGFKEATPKLALCNQDRF
mmetsp:Transcript_39665/g.38238  ORF Transcript_39665/g.38238 Transcript_39665/m.38238 type:complete len:98 (-) Transcript_39665:88-381(-)